MKLLFLLLLSASVPLFAQERMQFFVDAGTGLTEAGFPEDATGSNLKLSFTTGIHSWLFRFSLTRNTELTTMHPKEQVHAAAILTGYSHSLYTEHGPDGASVLEWNLLLMAGTSVLQTHHQPVRTVNGVPYKGWEYGSAMGLPVEVELQYLLPPFRGASLRLFKDFNAFRNFYGFSIAVVTGFF
jgi:hypothetical protein